MWLLAASSPRWSYHGIRDLVLNKFVPTLEVVVVDCLWMSWCGSVDELRLLQKKRKEMMWMGVWVHWTEQLHTEPKLHSNGLTAEWLSKLCEAVAIIYDAKAGRHWHAWPQLITSWYVSCSFAKKWSVHFLRGGWFPWSGLRPANHFLESVKKDYCIVLT